MKENIKDLKQRLQQINATIDDIVLNGGHVGLGDPLVHQAHVLRTKLSKLQKPKLPGVRIK